MLKFLWTENQVYIRSARKIIKQQANLSIKSKLTKSTFKLITSAEFDLYLSLSE